MTKRVAIVQSNYVPWKGYFDLIAQVDEFVLYDDAQYTRRDWRNRNRVKTQAGAQWLTIPVEQKGRYHQPIREVEVADPGWTERHWRTIEHAYGRAAAFAEYGPRLGEVYRAAAADRTLSAVNRRFLEACCGWLGIDTRLRWSSEFELAEGRTERLVDICRQAGATEYWSGPAARDYLDEAAFARHGIAVRWMDYHGYPEHPQLFPPFEHHVSIVDLLLNTGADARRFLRRDAGATDR
ncbi:MAG: WbqC family protein [Planctomycetota bacterium]